MTLTFNDASHRYRLDGRPVPNVTTIINGGLPKGALVGWAARTVAEAAVATPDTVAAMVRDLGPEAAAKALAAAPDAVRDKAAAQGTAVHDLAERLAHGEAAVLDGLDERTTALVTNYVGWLDLFEPEVVATERPVAHRALWYAGKFDLLARIGGTLWMLDLKTSRGVYHDTAVQVAAYAGAEFMVDPEGIEVPMPEVERMGVVHVTTEGADLYPLGPIDPAFREFKAALATYRGTSRRRRDVPMDTPVQPAEVGAAEMLWTAEGVLS